MRRRPPRSTLFPSTTLFRSEEEFAAGGEVELVSVGGISGIQAAINRRARRERRGTRQVKHTELVATGVVAAAEEDQRRIPLNSGHQLVSYIQSRLRDKIPRR